MRSPVFLLLLWCSFRSSTSFPTNTTYTPFQEHSAICSNGEDWIHPYFRPLDCQLALRRLAQDATDRRRTLYTFLAYGQQATSSFPTIYTPRRYVRRTCTIAIAMISEFLPGMLPDISPGIDWPGSDVSDFGTINTRASGMLEECVDRLLSGGFVNVGRHSGGIGIFVWSTGGILDEYWNLASANLTVGRGVELNLTLSDKLPEGQASYSRSLAWER